MASESRCKRSESGKICHPRWYSKNKIIHLKLNTKIGQEIPSGKKIVTMAVLLNQL
jgi:hypothetical protein